MAHESSNNILNVSIEGEDDLVHESRIEAYTVVLSASAHIASMLIGGGSSTAVIISITTRHNINRYSYMPVLILFLTCCSLNFIWSPMEVTGLIMFHYTNRHPFDRFVTIRTALYLFLMLLISITIALLLMEGIIIKRNYFGRMLRRFWPITSSVLGLFCSLFLTAIFMRKCLQSEDNFTVHYVITDVYIRPVILALTIVVFCIVAITLVIFTIFLIKEAVYWDDGRPYLRKRKIKFEIPEFLISQSNDCADDGGFESRSDMPLPTTPTRPIFGDTDSSCIKGEDASHISDLPTSNIVKPMGNKLGINLAQVLGRRRHTICQISDSNNMSTTPTDPIARAKQYSYVRKFSVDISALQAQLQNPKIFRDAPYQSDIDLSRKQQSDVSKSPVSKVLLPLKPLGGKIDEKDEKRIDYEKVNAEISSAGTNSKPPPVIMVSIDDTSAVSDGEEDILNETHSFQEKFHEVSKPIANADTTRQTHTMLNFIDATEDYTSAPTLESAASDTESEGPKMARFTLLMSLTFVLNMLPVLVTEVLDNSLSRHSFINISICTIAVSTIQTIVYPHLIISCDNVVHTAIRKLKSRVAKSLHF